MKIVLANNTELTPYVVLGTIGYIQGAKRDVLTFVFPVEDDMVALDELFTAENCESITIETDEGETYIHKGYTIRSELSKKPVMVQPETEESEAVYETRVMVSMAQRTEQEKQTAEMLAAMNALLTGEV